MNVLKLNDGQQKACESLKQFMNSEDKLFLLTGSAGTGKTSVIVNCLSDSTNINNSGKKIVFSATTNQAVSVIEKMLDARLVGNPALRQQIKCMTIHKLLKIKRKIDKDGNEMFITTIDDESPLRLINSKSIYTYDIIVIDEVSMMSKELSEKIITLADKIDGKIIFIGDKAQLPPINEDTSYIFKVNIPNYELTEVMRNGGNILNLSNQTRNLVMENKKVSFKKVDDGKHVKIYRDKNALVDNYISIAKKQINKDSKNQAKNQNQDGGTEIKSKSTVKLPIILTYTNKNCSEINNKVRNVLFNNPTNKYVDGDIVVFNKFYKLNSNAESYYTSQQAHITGVEVSNHKIENINFRSIMNIAKHVIKTETTTTTTLDEVPDRLKKEMCPICLVKKKNSIVATVCGHAFCKKCLDEWLKVAKICPMCRFDFTNNNLTVKDDKKLTDLIDKLRKFSDNKSYKTWLLLTHNKDNIITIHDDDMERYNADVDTIKGYLTQIKTHIDKKYKNDLTVMNTVLERLWDYYYDNFIDKFADIVYGYSITTHKSQGSTYPNVYIDMQDIIMNNPDEHNSHKCLYTAITRSSESIRLFY